MTLDLRHNRFDDLPLFLGWMPHLQTLLVDGNPLTCLPRCVVRAGNDAVLKWIKHKAMESTQPRWV
jgi:Leucine-rich repeat (LRR) protein